MGNDTELRAAEPTPSMSIPRDEGGGLTHDMNKIVRSVTGERPPIGERTRAAWSYARPYWNRMAWWVMLAISIIVVSLDLNARFNGFIGRSIEWVRINILATYPSIAFISGMVACYYLVLKARGDRE